MGVLIRAEPPSPESSWDYVRIYSSTTEEGTYSLVVSQAIANLTYYDVNGSSTTWYKVAYYNSDTEVLGSLSSAKRGVSADYTTPQKIKNYLQITNDFSDSTRPSLGTVFDYIKWAQDDIDFSTQHSWRDTQVENEYHTLPQRNNMNFYGSYRDIPIKLAHRNIKAIDTDKGDKIEIYNGSEWEDYVTAKTEGRTSDYWIDYTNGFLYIRLFFSPMRKENIRITYRYGVDTVPRDIEKLATLMVVRDILINEDRSVLLPSGESQNLSYEQKLNRIDKEINRITNNHREITFITK